MGGPATTDSSFAATDSSFAATGSSLAAFALAYLAFVLAYLVERKRDSCIGMLTAVRMSTG